jgi:nicotinamidase-related amidase
MDCQEGIVSIYTKGDKEAFLARAASALGHARSAGIKVIHVQVGFRPGLPEVSSRNTLVLFGIATSGVVLSTLLEASDADFRLAVIKDCCADLDPNVHDCLINRFFSSRVAVLSAHELAESS